MMPGFDPMLLFVLNLAGTFAFGLSGGMAGVCLRLDLFGVVVLAVVEDDLEQPVIVAGRCVGLTIHHGSAIAVLDPLEVALRRCKECAGSAGCVLESARLA